MEQMVRKMHRQRVVPEAPEVPLTSCLPCLGASLFKIHSESLLLSPSHSGPLLPLAWSLLTFQLISQLSILNPVSTTQPRRPETILEEPPAPSQCIQNKLLWPNLIIGYLLVTLVSCLPQTHQGLRVFAPAVCSVTFSSKTFMWPVPSGLI